MLGTNQDQEESEFNFFDSFDCHDDDDWLDFCDQSISFQYVPSNQKAEIENSISNAKDQFTLDVSQTPSEIVQYQLNHTDQEKKAIKKHKKPKTKITLTPAAEQFRRRLYRLLSNGEKKIVRKEYVFLYHSLISERYPYIRDVRREEYRSIGNYFNSFAHQQNPILSALREIKQNGIPEVKFIF